jgi:hypothetical protein
MADQVITPEMQRNAQLLLSDICSSFVSLSGVAVPLDHDGKDSGRDQSFFFSGFMVSYLGRWFYLTAGHALDDFNTLLIERRIRLRQCSFMDYFGKEAKHTNSPPVDLVSLPKAIVDDYGEGLDFAVVGLPQLYGRMMEQNGVRPFAMDGWRQGKALIFSDYGVLGLPDEKMDKKWRIGAKGETIIGGVQVVLMLGKRVEASPASNMPHPRVPWLAIELRDQGEIKSMVGMSGGPIIGIIQEPGRNTRYTAIGIQAWWDKERKIAFGTPIERVLELFDAEAQKLKDNA